MPGDGAGLPPHPGAAGTLRLAPVERKRIRLLLELGHDELGGGSIRALEDLHAHGAARIGEPDGELVAWAFAGCTLELLGMAAEICGDKPLSPAELRELMVARGTVQQNFAEAEATAERQRAAERAERVAAARRRGLHPERARRLRLAFDPDLRTQAGEALGGRRRGDRIVGVPCPSCRKRSVWLWRSPERASWARCNHENSCGWAGPLAALGVR